MAKKSGVDMNSARRILRAFENDLRRAGFGEMWIIEITSLKTDIRFYDGTNRADGQAECRLICRDPSVCARFREADIGKVEDNEVTYREMIGV